MSTADEQDWSARALSPALRLVSNALNQMRFGSIQLTVHDGKVMQVDVTERKRFEK